MAVSPGGRGNRKKILVLDWLIPHPTRTLRVGATVVKPTAVAGAHLYTQHRPLHPPQFRCRCPAHRRRPEGQPTPTSPSPSPSPTSQVPAAPSAARPLPTPTKPTPTPPRSLPRCCRPCVVVPWPRPQASTYPRAACTPRPRLLHHLPAAASAVAPRPAAVALVQGQPPHPTALDRRHARQSVDGVSQSRTHPFCSLFGRRCSLPRPPCTFRPDLHVSSWRWRGGVGACAASADAPMRAGGAQTGANGRRSKMTSRQ